MPRQLSFDQRIKRGLPFEKRWSLQELFQACRDQEYQDDEAEFDLVISSSGDHGSSACGTFAGALWLLDHATIFLRAMRHHRSNRPIKQAELLEASAAILKAFSVEIDLPEESQTLQLVSRIFVDLGVAVSTASDSTDWENQQRQKIESFVEQASFSLSGTGNELYVLPWALEVERSATLPTLEGRVHSLRQILPGARSSHPIEACELNMWAYFLLLIGRWKAATAMATVATEMEAVPANLDTLGWAHFFERNTEKALSLTSAAMEIHERLINTSKWERTVWSEWAEAGYHRCYVLTYEGKKSEASEVLKKLSAFAPDSFWTRKASDLGSLLEHDEAEARLGRRSGKSYEFDVALSFAGEDRFCALQIAERLRTNGITVFYDDFEKAELWGKNLYSHLSDLYQNRARYCVMLVSQNYASKPWPRLEREAAQARAFQSATEYILPVRIDSSPVPGLLSTVGYLDWQHEGPDRIVELLCQKLRR